MDLFLNLLVNGLANGVLLFVLAIGLTLVFGLMDVLNLTHGGVFAMGAYAYVWIYTLSNNYLLAILAALLIGFLLGVIIERLIIRTVYGNHMLQIIITLGVILILSELLKVFWGPNPLVIAAPPYLQGYWNIGGVILIKYRAFLIAVGLAVFLGTLLLFHRTRLGLIVRAGVINKELIQVHGVNIQKVFWIVFVSGSVLAALGGALFAPFSRVVFAEIGLEYGIFALIVVVIGGMGSIIGSAVAALLIGLANVFIAYYVPPAVLAVNMLVLAGVLLFKPTGLFGVKGVEAK